MNTMLFRRVVDQSRSFASLDFCSGMGQSEGGLGKLNVTMFLASIALLSCENTAHLELFFSASLVLTGSVASGRYLLPAFAAVITLPRY